MSILHIILILLGLLLSWYVLYEFKIWFDYCFSSDYHEAKSLVGKVLVRTKSSESVVYSAVPGNPSLVIVCIIHQSGQILFIPTTVRKSKEFLNRA